jgi:hypothetical protein
MTSGRDDGGFRRIGEVIALSPSLARFLEELSMNPDRYLVERLLSMARQSG